MVTRAESPYRSTDPWVGSTTRTGNRSRVGLPPLWRPPGQAQETTVAMTHPPHPDQPSHSTGPVHGAYPPGPPAGQAGDPAAQGRPPYAPPPQRPPADDLGRAPSDRYPGGFGGPHASEAPSPGGAAVQRDGYTRKSFFGALLDLSFDHMVTIRLIRLSYVLVLAFTVVSALALLLLAWSFSEWNGMLALLTMLATPVICLFQILATRMFLEFLINQFKITEELRKLRESGGFR